MFSNEVWVCHTAPSNGVTKYLFVPPFVFVAWAYLTETVSEIVLSQTTYDQRWSQIFFAAFSFRQQNSTAIRHSATQWEWIVLCVINKLWFHIQFTYAMLHSKLPLIFFIFVFFVSDACLTEPALWSFYLMLCCFLNLGTSHDRLLLLFYFFLKKH